MFALELDGGLVRGGKAAPAVPLAVLRLQHVLQRRDALVGRQLDRRRARREKVEEACEEAFDAVDDGVANLLGGLLHRAANLLHDAVHDRLKRVAGGAEQLLVGVGVLGRLLAPLGSQDLDELADANAGAHEEVFVVLELVVARAQALEGDADGGEHVVVEPLHNLVDGRQHIVRAKLVTERARRRGAGAVGRGA